MTTLNRIRQFWTGSISRRLVLGVCGIVMLVMATFSYTIVERQHNFLEHQAIQHASALTETLAVNSVSWVLTNDLSGLADVIASTGKYPNLNYVMVVGTNGQVLAHSQARQVGQYVVDADSVNMLNGPPTPRVIKHTDSALETVAPIMADNRIIGWARICASHSHVGKSIREITREGIYFGLAALLLAGLFVGTVTRNLARGLDELVGVTQRIAAGDTGTRVALHREDELGALGNAFDTMAAALEKTSQELRNNEREVRKLLANLPVAVLIHTPDGAINYVNEAARDILGIPSHELADGDAFSPYWHLVREDGSALPEAEAPCRRAFNTGHAVKGQVIGLIMRNSVKPLWLHVNAFPDVDTEGRVRRAIIVFLDITDRKQAAELLHQRAEEFRALIENAPDPIIRYNRQAQRIYVNPAMVRLTGAPASELVGATSTGRSVLGRQQSNRMQQAVCQVLKTGQPHDGQFDIRDVTGKRRYMHVRLFPERGQSGEVATVLSISTDITPVIETQRQLHSLVVNLPDYIARFDPNGRPLFVSPTITAAFGTPASREFRAISDVFPAMSVEARGQLIENIHRVTATGAQVMSEIHVEMPTGQRIMEARTIPELDHHSAVNSVLCIIRDITERVGLMESLRQLSAAVEQSPVTVFIADTNGAIRYVNPAFAACSGYTEAEVLGKTPRVLQSGATDAETYDRLWTTIKNGESWHGTLQNRRKDGSLYWVEAVITPVRDQRGVITQFVAIEQDVTDRKDVEARIEFLAHHDALTGLPNRLLGKDRMEMALRHSDRHDCKAALIFLDLDGFKRVNDTLGHGVGDELLKEVSARLLSSIRKSDTVARQGGDEFLIVLPEIRDTEAVRMMVRRFMEKMTQPFIIEGHDVGISASIGIAVYPDDGPDWEALLKNADVAMYAAKEAGRNAYRFFDVALNETAAVA